MSKGGEGYGEAGELVGGSACQSYQKGVLYERWGQICLQGDG